MDANRWLPLNRFLLSLRLLHDVSIHIAASGGKLRKHPALLGSGCNGEALMVVQEVWTGRSVWVTFQTEHSRRGCTGEPRSWEPAVGHK